MIDLFKGENAFLSNFYEKEVKVFGIVFPTAEHAYQWCKTTDPKSREKILHSPYPGYAKKVGKFVILRPNWDTKRLSAMEKIVRAKFTDPELSKKLLATGEEELVEGNYWGDTYWGICKGVGTNHLGKILMKIRKELSKR